MASRSIHIDRGDIGTRVDRVLLRHLADVPGLSRNKIQRLIAAGAVRINGQPAARASWRIAAGDCLSVDLPESRARQRPRPEALPLDVLFEDEFLVAVNKPAGQVTHPAFKNTSGTLLNALLAHADGRWVPALINRLDKDTSGIVLVGKSTAVQKRLQDAMQRNQVEKDYLTVVRGKPVPKRGVIELALTRHAGDRRRVTVSARAGQTSITVYERLRTAEDQTISLVRCRLVTGRTHQIRVHLAANKWPILGDLLYGTKDARVPRQALHAWRLRFDHPVSGERVEITAPIPSDLESLVSRIGDPT